MIWWKFYDDYDRKKMWSIVFGLIGLDVPLLL